MTSSQTATGQSSNGQHTSERPDGFGGHNASASGSNGASGGVSTHKKRKHRGGRKKRARRQSFAAPSESTVNDNDEHDRRPSLLDGPRPSAASSTGFYRLKNGNKSNTSLESEALLDHRYVRLEAWQVDRTNTCKQRTDAVQVAPSKQFQQYVWCLEEQHPRSALSEEPPKRTSYRLKSQQIPAQSGTSRCTRRRF